MGKWQELDWLELDGNLLTSLPESIGELKELMVLYLGSNPIAFFPDSMSGLIQLDELHYHSETLNEEQKERLQTLLPDCELTFESW